MLCGPVCMESSAPRPSSWAVDVGAFFDVAQGFEGEVEKVAGAAGRVEDAEVR